METSNSKINYWNWFSYLWAVVVNIFTTGVVFAIYSNVFASFEVIVVSLLILIYLSVQSFLMIYGNITTRTAFGLNSEFLRIRKLLKDVPEEYEIEETQEVEKKAMKATVKMYINGVFLFIIYLIALFNLFGAL